MASEDIIPVEEVEEEVVIEEEQPVVSLLNRLKCPKESDLARKRKVQTNPCKGVKVPFLLSHRKFLSPLELKNFIFLPIRENSCDACREFLSLKKSVNALHVN